MWKDVIISVSSYLILTWLKDSFLKIYWRDPDSNPDSRPERKRLFRFWVRIRPKVSDPYGSGFATLVAGPAYWQRGGGAGRLANSYDCKKAWASTICSFLSDSGT